jgi:hypothetical protein
MAIDPGWRPEILGHRLIWRRGSSTPGDPHFDGPTPVGEVAIYQDLKSRDVHRWEFRWWPRGWGGRCVSLDGFRSAEHAAEEGARFMDKAVGAIVSAYDRGDLAEVFS